MNMLMNNLKTEDVPQYSFEGKEDWITCQHLLNGETCKVMGVGNSMTPILQSKQCVIVEPVTEDTELNKKDIVLCKVRGHFYLHLINCIKNSSSYQIANNHGHVNGTITRKNIYGKVTHIL